LRIISTSIKSARKKNESATTTKVSGYLHKRKILILCSLFILAGIALSSIFIAGNNENAIMASEIIRMYFSGCAEGFLWALKNKATAYIFIIFYLFFCAGSRMGKIIIYILPFLYGTYIGAVNTVLLSEQGISAFKYISVCIIFPSILEVIILVSASVTVIKLSAEIKKPDIKPHSSLPILIYAVGLVICGLIKCFLQTAVSGIF